MTRPSPRSARCRLTVASAVAPYLTGRGPLRCAVGPVDRLADVPAAPGALMTCSPRPRTGGGGQ